MHALLLKKLGALLALFAACFVLAGAYAIADPITYKTKGSEIQFFDGNPRRIFIHRMSPQQDDIKILGRSKTDMDCHVIGLVNYDLIMPPANGIACFRDEIATMKIHPYGNGDGRCLGVPALSRIVYYRPGGAHPGHDTFQYALVNAQHDAISIADVTLVITPPAHSKREPRATDTPTEKAQSPGPMPRCPEAVM
jgi:hypothetical protein